MKHRKRKVSVLAAALAVPVALSALPESAYAGILSSGSGGETYEATLETEGEGTAKFTDAGIFKRNATSLSFAEGGEVSVTPSPTGDGYLSAIYVTAEDGENLEFSMDDDGDIVFTMPDADVTVEVVYDNDTAWLTEDAVIADAGTDTGPEEGDLIVVAADTGYDGPESVDCSADYDDILALLPETVTVTLEDGTQEEVEVTWSSVQEELYRTAPEVFVTLAFTAELPDGYCLDPDDAELHAPGINLEVTGGDIYGTGTDTDTASSAVSTLSAAAATTSYSAATSSAASTLAVSSGYLAVGSSIYYGGYETHRFTFNGYEAYCLNPELDTPSSGTYSVTDITGTANRLLLRASMGLYYGYGGPEFTTYLFPGLWYDGTEMTPDRYRALTHIYLAGVYAENSTYALEGTNDEFRKYFSYYMVGDGTYGEPANSQAFNKALAGYGWGLLGGDDEWPSGFNVYVISTGSSSQTMISFDYTEYGSPVYSTTKYTARDAISPSLDLYIEKVDVDNTDESLAGAEFEVYMDGSLVATVTTDEDGIASYHWRGSAVYTSYATASNNYVVNYSSLSPSDQAAVPSGYYTTLSAAFNNAKSSVQSALSTALTNLKSSTTHTWKVVETKAPDGYKNGELVWEQTLDATVTAVKVTYGDPADEFPFQITKTSGDTGITADNSCYSLEGAVYEVYESREDALNGVNAIETLTTDENGETEAVPLQIGNVYYVKEVTAPSGYLLCDGSADGAEDGIHVVDGTEASARETLTVECADPPAYGTMALSLDKMDAATGGDPAGTASLQGAVFSLSYYDNTDGNTSGTATRIWYYMTDTDGHIDFADPSYLASGYDSPGLYTDSDGNIILPIGTCLVKEVSPPMYYQLSGTMNFAGSGSSASVTTGLRMVLKQDSNGAEPSYYAVSGTTATVLTTQDIEAYDQPMEGSVKIIKRKGDGTEEPLSGVTFTITGLTTGTTYTATTGSDGTIVWDGLVPDEYVITEAGTADGFSLLADNIELTIPLEMSLSEINSEGADISQAVWDEVSGTYCFYDLTFTVDDSVTFEMPFTGGSGTVRAGILAAGAAAAAAGAAVLAKRRKKRRWRLDD